MCQTIESIRKEVRIGFLVELILETLDGLGKIQKNTRKKIEAETDIETLKEWYRLANRADSVGEFEKAFSLLTEKPGI